MGKLDVKMLNRQGNRFRWLSPSAASQEQPGGNKALQAQHFGRVRTLMGLKLHLGKPKACVTEFWRVVLLHKGLLLMLALGSLAAEFNLVQFQSVLAHWPQTDIPTLSSHFATWDSAHYLALSEDGYHHGSASCAFYPAWPAASHAVTFYRQESSDSGAIVGERPLANCVLVVLPTG